MASFGKLYTYIPNARILKIQAAAKINGLEIDVVPDFQMGVTNKTDDFLAKFPAGKVPALESTSGDNISESDAITQYVAESGPRAAELLGGSAGERARVRQWVCFSETEVMAHVIGLILWRVGYVPFDAGAEEKGVEALRCALRVVERRLQGRAWLALDGLSVADLTLASALYWAFMHVVDAPMREEFPLAVAWYLRTVGSPVVCEVFGPPKLVDVRKVPDVERVDG